MKSCNKALKKAKNEKEEYEMPKEKAIEEHKRLTRVLRTKKGIDKEYKIQRSELAEMKKK